MRWRFGVRRSCGALKLHLTGRACFVLAFWLLAVPFPWVAAAAAAAAVHELGHLTAVWMFGGSVTELEFDAFGAKMVTSPMEAKEELVCALAGPLFGALVCLFWRWIPRTAICAAMQTMFNLLPVWPLDGGRALLCLRNICCKDGRFGVQ